MEGLNRDGQGLAEGRGIRRGWDTTKRETRIRRPISNIPRPCLKSHGDVMCTMGIAHPHTIIFTRKKKNRAPPEARHIENGVRVLRGSLACSLCQASERVLAPATRRLARILSHDRIFGVLAFKYPPVIASSSGTSQWYFLEGLECGSLPAR